MTREKVTPSTMRARPEGAPPAAILIIATWFALLTGLGEVARLAYARFYQHKFIHFGVHIIWMAPLASLIVFAIPALVLSLAARRWPKLVSMRSVIFIFACLGFMSLLYGIAALHKYAALVLAAGMAVQASNFAVAHPRGFYKLVRYSMGWAGVFGQQRATPTVHAFDGVDRSGGSLNRREFLLSAGITFAGLATGARGWQALVERRVRGRIPPAAPNSPNVLLIVLDTVRARSLSLYGYNRRTTPELERLARSGVLFERAISTEPWTLPSHASMFTGRYPHELSTGFGTPLDSTYPTLAEVLTHYGYATAGFVANTYYCGYEHGLSRGFAHYDDYGVSVEEVVLSSSLGRALVHNNRIRRVIGDYDVFARKSAQDINRVFSDWLAGNQRRPFFAFLNYYDAHEPYLAPPPFDTLFGPQPPQPNARIQYDLRRAWQPRRRKMSAEEQQAELAGYDGCIAYLDHHVGALLDDLEQQGLRQNTMVIVTADHGEEFGEHGFFVHGNTLYLPAVHVPLLILFPSHAPAGKRVSELVTLRDLPATVLDLLGLTHGYSFPGAPLARHWNGAPMPNPGATDVVLSELGVKWRSLFANGMHYIKPGEDDEELYDIDRDPWETQDLAKSEEDQGTLKKLRATLQAILTAQ